MPVMYQNVTLIKSLPWPENLLWGARVVLCPPGFQSRMYVKT